jgi:hypothetical protein
MRQCGVGLSVRSAGRDTPFRIRHIAPDQRIGVSRTVGNRHTSAEAKRANAETSAKKTVRKRLLPRNLMAHGMHSGL